MLERIKEIQRHRRITSTAIAAAAGMDASYVRHILKGDNRMDCRVLVAILQLLPDVSPDYLMLGRGGIFRESSDSSQLAEINRRLAILESLLVDKQQADAPQTCLTTTQPCRTASQNIAKT